MANKSKKKSTKVTKGSIKANKYSKLMLAASKELEAKKKALVKAEKALAKVTKTHQDLLSEVARLDMVERSLKALVEGTEPPHNVRYVYTYPNWVYPNPYGWCWNGNGHTYTIGNAQTQTYGTLQGGSLLTTGTNCINTTPSSFTYTSNAGGLATCNNVQMSNTVDNGGSGIGSVLSTSGDGTVAWTSTTPTVNLYNSSVSGTADFTVDLSTHATEDEPVEEPMTVGIGG
jgi:hypothetical protein